MDGLGRCLNVVNVKASTLPVGVCLNPLRNLHLGFGGYAGPCFGLGGLSRRKRPDFATSSEEA